MSTPGANRPDDLSDGPNADPGQRSGASSEVVEGIENSAALNRDSEEYQRFDAHVDLARVDVQEEAGNTQDEPAMDMHQASDRDKIRGIVAQTRADFPSGSDPDQVERALRQRFDDTGITVDEAQIKKLAAGD